MDRVLTPFWNATVKLLPLWMAPNLVTLIGTLIVILTSLQYMSFEGLSMNVEMPKTCYLISAIGAFWYQTFDAIDGK